MGDKDHKVDMSKIKEGARELKKLLKKGAKKLGASCKKTWQTIKHINKVHNLTKKQKD